MKNQLFILYFLFSTSCTQELSIPDHLPEIGAPALHSVQSKRLKTLMNELNDLMFERMLDEVQIDRQRRYRTEEIVNVAEKLLITVEFIPDAIQQLFLDKNEQKIFLNCFKSADKCQGIFLLIPIVRFVAIATINESFMFFRRF